MNRLLENDIGNKSKIESLKIKTPLALFIAGLFIEVFLILIVILYQLNKSGIEGYFWSLQVTNILLIIGIQVINILLLVLALKRKKEIFARVASAIVLFYLGVSLWRTLFTLFFYIVAGYSDLLSYLGTALSPIGLILEIVALYAIENSISRYNKNQFQEQKKAVTTTLDFKLVVTSIVLLVVGVVIAYIYKLDAFFKYQLEIAKMSDNRISTKMLILDEVGLVINLVLIAIPIIFMMVSLYTRKKAVTKKLALITLFLLAHMAYSSIIYMFVFLLFKDFDYAFLQFIIPSCGCVLIMIAMWLMVLGIKEKK